MTTPLQANSRGGHAGPPLQDELVRVRGLVKHFPVEGSDDVVRAIDGVSFEIRRPLSVASDRTN